MTIIAKYPAIFGRISGILQPDIRYLIAGYPVKLIPDIRPDIQYPAMINSRISSIRLSGLVLFAGYPVSGYPAKSLSGTSLVVTSLFDEGVIRKKQEYDTQISVLRGVLSKAKPVKKWPVIIKLYKPFKNRMHLNHGLIYYNGKQNVPVIPYDLLVDTVVNTHKSMAHIGRDKLIHLISRHVWHPQLHSVCSDVCVSCPDCQLMKVSRQCYAPPTLKISTNYPFEC